MMDDDIDNEVVFSYRFYIDYSNPILTKVIKPYKVR
jgi:hypothetical protein